MQIIKIHTTHSTNDALKKLQRESPWHQFTVLTAHNQTEGRGEGTNSWFSESGKNLLFSILIKHKNLQCTSQFFLNQLVSLAVHKVLKELIPSISVKWPNDIMAGSHKIAGILIENTIKGNLIKNSIVGIGINVNQTDFSMLPNLATSIINQIQVPTDLAYLLTKIINEIEIQYLDWEKNSYPDFTSDYLRQLFGFRKFLCYETTDGKRFDAQVVQVEKSGKLVLEKKNGEQLKFNKKEVRLCRL